MGNNSSRFFSSKKPSDNEVRMNVFRRYTTKSELFNAIQLNENHFLAVGNELGTLLLYDLNAGDEVPKHTRYLEYTSGGVSDMLWINNDFLAVGTTRGNIVVFSTNNEHGYLNEVCNVKAHGDGAARIPVESMDYCKASHRLVTVGEGVGSVRVWSVLPTGILIPVELSAVSTAYLIPNFVSFTNKGSKVLVGFTQTARVDVISLEPFKVLDSCVLDQDIDHRKHQALNGALWLEAVNQLAVLNSTEGLRLYDSSLQRKEAKPLTIEDNRHQQLACIKGGLYFAVATTNSCIQIFHSQDATLISKFKVPGKKTTIQAIHASPSKDGYDLLAAASCADGQPTTLTVWSSSQIRCDSQVSGRASDFSTFRIIIVCALVSFLCQFLLPTIIDHQVISNLVNVRVTETSSIFTTAPTNIGSTVEPSLQYTAAVSSASSGSSIAIAPMSSPSPLPSIIFL